MSLFDYLYVNSEIYKDHSFDNVNQGENFPMNIIVSDFMTASTCTDHLYIEIILAFN